MQGRGRGITTQSSLFTSLSGFAAREAKTPTARPRQALGGPGGAVTGTETLRGVGPRKPATPGLCLYLRICNKKWALPGTPSGCLQPNREKARI